MSRVRLTRIFTDPATGKEVYQQFSVSAFCAWHAFEVFDYNSTYCVFTFACGHTTVTERVIETIEQIEKRFDEAEEKCK